MTSPNISEIAVDDLLVVPEIQELLTTDADLETASTVSGSIQIDTPAEIEEQRSVCDSSIDAIEESEEARTSWQNYIDDEKHEGQEEKQGLAVIDQLPRSIAENDDEAKVIVSDPSSVTLPTGQHVHVLNGSELADLCRKVVAKTAAVSHAKHKKEEERRLKLQTRQLQAELSRLQYKETKLKQYERRSVESLQGELELHQRAIADLAQKLQRGAQHELTWVNSVNDSLRK
ncbi:hypothetical protein GN244_ATG13423 [Phytophthora infestans]|uniref:Uncharacterized protein n=1 Tax=Phytophthora infestans TaxID=4787 RepID=A0A833VYU5_PHYIN|nr:hypothetical protein GN244_ATG13423 [Phytophthora infestans]KAF4144010.1 hypothetical protein GN958_ATG06803 [Phytophthora infestans]